MWGALCSDGFDAAEAAVVCRQLGLEGAAVTAYPTTTWSQLSWVANLSCSGTEERLVDCQHVDATQAACESGYAVVTCTPNQGGW